jgi:hypothetical protein
MAKRRTSGIQRRGRASETALNRRVGEGGGGGLLDMRLLLIGGVLLIGAVVVVVVVLFAGGGGGRVGERQVDQGGGHIADGSIGGPYSSSPATSGEHWNTPANWGVYTLVPAVESQVIHNLEHGGIVIWYQPALTSEEDITALTNWTEQQVRSAKFKVILSPWTGADFGHPIAVTAWDWLLYLDSADTDQIRAFLDDHYQQSPEPYGGPGQPAT